GSPLDGTRPRGGGFPLSGTGVGEYTSGGESGSDRAEGSTARGEGKLAPRPDSGPTRRTARPAGRGGATISLARTPSGGSLMAAPHSIDALCQQARQAFAERNWEKARQAYQQALGLKSDVPDIHQGLATVCFQMRDLAGAAHHFKEVTRLDPRR